MAEAATIIALGTFGVQTAKIIFQLVQARSFIKKSRTDVLMLIDEAERLQSILEARKREQDHFAGIVIPDTVWLMCEDHCETASQKLKRTATELLCKIHQQRTGGSLAAHLAKDTISKLLDSLQSAKQDIMLADNAFTRIIQYDLLARARRSENILEQLLFRTTQRAVNNNDVNSYHANGVVNSTVKIDYFVFLAVQKAGRLEILQTGTHGFDDRRFFKVLRMRHDRARGIMWTHFSIFILSSFDVNLFQKLGQSEYIRVKAAVPPPGTIGYKHPSPPSPSRCEMQYLLQKDNDLCYDEGNSVIRGLPQRDHPLQENSREPDVFWGLYPVYHIRASLVLTYGISAGVISSLLCITAVNNVWTCFGGCIVSWTLVPFVVMWAIAMLS